MEEHMMSIRGRRAFLMAASAALLLGACTAHPGTAVSVGGQSYTDAQIAQGVEQYASMSGQKVAPAQLVWLMPQVQNIITLGKDLGVTVSDADVAEQVSTLVASGQLKAPSADLGPVMTDFMRYLAVRTKISQLQLSPEQMQELGQRLQHMNANPDVQVNPRYGAVNQQTGETQMSLFGDVVRLSESPAAPMGNGRQ